MAPADTEQRRTLIAALLWAVIPSLIIFTVARAWISDAEIKKMLYAGAGTLFFGEFLGGMLKMLLDEHVAARRRREERAGCAMNVLAYLKSVNDRVARARIVIPAHQSAATYDDASERLRRELARVPGAKPVQARRR